MILDPAARLAPTRVADTTAFDVGFESYSWDDVVLAATMWGDWQRLRERVRAAARRRAQQEARGDAPTRFEIERATEEYRRAHHLPTAAEAQAWLRRRGLGLGDLTQHIERMLTLRDGPPGADDLAAAGEAEANVEEALWGEAVLSGDLAGFADRLAERAALHQHTRQSNETHTCPRAMGPGEVLGLCASPLQRLQWLRHLDECFARHGANGGAADGERETRARWHERF